MRILEETKEEDEEKSWKQGREEVREREGKQIGRLAWERKLLRRKKVK